MANIKINVHDNEVHSYEFCFPEKTLTLKTSHQNDKTDIQFITVLVYSFENARDQNILFDVVRIEEFVRLYSADREEENEFEYGFPIGNFSNPKDLLSFLQTEAYHYYEIDSSVGLYGYVIAKDMQTAALDGEQMT